MFQFAQGRMGLLGGQKFNPAKLFVGGTQGAWYDPSDSTTLFSDTAGTTPCATPGGGTGPIAVGLMLDKSQGLALGSELVSNTGGPFTSTTGWVNTSLTIPATPSVVNGRLRITSNIVGGSNDPRVYATITGLTVGKCYKISYVGSSGTASGCSVAMTNTPPASDVTGGTAANVVGTDVATSFIRVAAATTEYIRIVVNGSAMGDGKYVEVSSITVKELAGNHAIRYGGTTTAPELSARVNLLTYSEQFDDAAWLKDVSGTPVVSISANSTTAPDGTVTADTLTELAVTNFHRIAQSFTFASGVTYTCSVYVKNASGSRYVGLSPVGSQTAGNNCTAVFDLQNKKYLGVQTAGSALFGSVTSPTITELANGWFRLSLSFSATPGGAGGPSVWLLDTFVNNGISQGSYTGDGTSGIYIWGADLRPSNIGANVPAYQRIADAYTYDSNGFPRYLKFDGFDDGMYTPANLNLGIDKATVFAGVRKLSDAANGMVTELSALSGIGNPGSFAYSVAASGANSFWRSCGTLNASGVATGTPAAPVSIIATGIGNISGDISQLYENKVLGFNSTADQGAGNYGTYPLYIGSRNNTSVWLNGQIYSLIVVGAASTAAQISSTESWIAGKEGITL